MEKTNYEKIIEMPIQELAEWLDENGIFDDAPWTTDFARTYCQKCEAVYSFGVPHSYCDLDKKGKCRFFPNKEPIDNLAMIRLWLEKKED